MTGEPPHQDSPALENRLLRNLKGRRKPRAHQSDLEAIAEGLASARAGHLIDHRKVKAWLESWGREAEQDRPR